MKQFKYSTLENCLLHASDNLAVFAKEVEFQAWFESTLVEFYAAGLLFCSPEWNAERKQRFSEYFSIYEYKTLPVHPRTEEVLWMNNLLHLLHLLHLEDYNLRVDAIEWLGRTVKDLEKEVYFQYDGHITGKTGFPEDLRQEVTEVLSKYSDISVAFTTTWYYSHLDMGDDYAYNKDEIPYIKIAGISSESIDIAIEDLKNNFNIF